MRIRRSAGIPVAGASHGEKTGLIAVAYFDQQVERPLSTRDDREVRSSEPQHRCPGDFLESRLGASNRGAELCGGLTGDAGMIQAVRCDFMARARNGANEFDLAFE